MSAATPNQLSQQLVAVLPGEVIDFHTDEICRVTDLYTSFDNKNQDVTRTGGCLEHHEGEVLGLYSEPRKRAYQSAYDGRSVQLIFDNDHSADRAQDAESGIFLPVAGPAASTERLGITETILRDRYMETAEGRQESERVLFAQALVSLAFDLSKDPVEYDNVVNMIIAMMESELWDGVTGASNMGRTSGDSVTVSGLAPFVSELGSIVVNTPAGKAPRSIGVSHPSGRSNSPKNREKMLAQIPVEGTLKRIGDTITANKLFLDAHKRKRAFEWLEANKLGEAIDEPAAKLALDHAIDVLDNEVQTFWDPTNITTILDTVVKPELVSKGLL